MAAQWVVLMSKDLNPSFCVEFACPLCACEGTTSHSVSVYGSACDLYWMSHTFAQQKLGQALAIAYLFCLNRVGSDDL